MAFITVSDAAGRVLFRRRATETEVADAVRAAEQADEGAEAAMHEIASQRYAALAAGTTIVEDVAPPPELAEFEEVVQAEPSLEEEEQPEEVPHLDEAGLFHENDALEDSIDPWFGDARFSEETNFLDDEDVAS